ncbi:uncharacterized protein [Palaemon carinicauda]|uniref:uncharacterized protein n=1 Tax=Palaemon carinicauda TaxID=392227 RepID=UPI0035B62C63
MNFLRPILMVAIVLAMVICASAFPEPSGGYGHGLGGFGGGIGHGLGGGFGHGLGGGFGGVTVVRPVVSRVVVSSGLGGFGGGRYGGYGW